jgi:hypothetical protein
LFEDKSIISDTKRFVSSDSSSAVIVGLVKQDNTVFVIMYADIEYKNTVYYSFKSGVESGKFFDSFDLKEAEKRFFFWRLSGMQPRGVHWRLIV